MSENQVAIVPYGKCLHILTDQGDTLCGITPPRNSKIFNYYPRSLDLKFCEDCLMYVGKEMVVDYFGYGFFDAEPSQVKHRKSDSKRTVDEK